MRGAGEEMTRNVRSQTVVAGVVQGVGSYKKMESSECHGVMKLKFQPFEIRVQNIRDNIAMWQSMSSRLWREGRGAV